MDGGLPHEKDRSVYILIVCLLLTLCACESAEERRIREGRERAEEINKNIERNKQQSEQLNQDMSDLVNIMNGK